MSQIRNNYNKIATESGAIGSGTTTTYHTEPGVSIIDLEAIATAYEEVLGPMNYILGRKLKRYIDLGMRANVIIDAIEITAMAPRPSFYYLEAILERYRGSGIMTMEDVEMDRARREKRRRRAYNERIGYFYSLPDDSMPF